jgi:chemotaxis protein histidine kinase CheA
MALAGGDDREKLSNLCKKTYKEQAIWFLNASWLSNEKSAEDFWKYVQKCADLDLQKKATGCELDELNTHRFLEHFKNERTVKELRDELRKVGVDNFKYIPLTMFLIWNYKLDWHRLVNAPQGADSAEMQRATQLLEQSQKACNEAIRLADEANARAEELRKAEAEVAAALAELKAQEDAFNNKTEDLKKKSEEGSTVQKSRAANELAQHLASDPLPLRKAKLNTEAAKRKAEKARVAGEEAAAKAEAARLAAEAAVEEAKRKVAEAEAYLDEVRAAASAGQGTLWWMDRELQEQKKYMPQSKGGTKK